LQVRVYVSPRQGILDPQGRAVENALKSLGFADASNVHIGRYITLEVKGDSRAAVEAEVARMCDQLLANPLIEDYRFEVEGG
jgi:phosphoribosylformylglycinamidine synthase